MLRVGSQTQAFNHIAAESTLAGRVHADNYFRKAVEAASLGHLNLASLLQFSISIVERTWIVCFEAQGRSCRKEMLTLLYWAALFLHK